MPSVLLLGSNTKQQWKPQQVLSTGETPVPLPVAVWKKAAMTVVPGSWEAYVPPHKWTCLESVQLTTVSTGQGTLDLFPLTRVSHFLPLWVSHGFISHQCVSCPSRKMNWMSTEDSARGTLRESGRQQWLYIVQGFSRFLLLLLH